MGTLVSSLFAFGAHANNLSFRVWESIVQYRHGISQEPYIPLDLFAGLFPHDSLMSSCNCIIMSFACLIEPYIGFPNFQYQAYSLSLSHVQPRRAILYILCNLIPYFYQEGTFPRVLLSYMCPCIEHRYVPLLGTSLFPPMTLVSSQSITIKQFYSFSIFLNI